MSHYPAASQMPRLRPLCALLLLALASLLLHPSSADIYLHNPRGSNNRLNEQTATRTNNNRVFNSQNNARGGYNVGDRTASPWSTNDQVPPNYFTHAVPSVDQLDAMFDPAANATGPDAQHSLVYLEGSVLQVEWTNQHGCGGSEGGDPYKLNCDLILQYMCETGGDDQTDQPGGIIRGAETLRDGGTTNQLPTPTTYVTNALLVQPDFGTEYVRHESANYYYECANRLRNQGLFTADQNLGNNQYATATRQNPNAGQSGYECPEERDYYPYWSPSPWKDIAVLTDHASDKCDAQGRYKGASQNNNAVYRCVPTVPQTDVKNYLGSWGAITQAACTSFQGAWIAYTHNLTAPACMQAPWSRVNHLGNGRDGQSLAYNWTLPMLSDLTANGVNLVGGVTSYAKCVFRLRYNISTDDFDPAATDYTSNGVNSPIKTNQQYDIGAPLGLPLTLQLNTAQLARTFQDRSHVFYIATRPAAFVGRTIYNVNVRGKRCNIVQCYPAVEYDFVPAALSINASTDLVHLQWTGSNTHNNGGGGGDGQAGDDGQGRDGTDRNNLIPLLNYGNNFPIAYDQVQDNMLSRANCLHINGSLYGSTWGNYTAAASTGTMTAASVDCALYLWTSGYYLNKAAVQAAYSLPQLTGNGNDGKSLDDQVNMNNAPASLIGGVLLDYRMSGLTSTTTYPFISTRNNAFSNRGQKGSLTVHP